MNATSRTALVDMAMSYSRSRMICAAARLGIADVLHEGHRSVDDIAVVCGAEPGALYRLLRALASIGIVVESEPGSFSLTSLGEPLRKDAANSVWPSVVFWADLLADSWSQLTECVRTGETAARVMAWHGVKSRWAQDPAAAGAILRGVMGAASTEEFLPFVNSWDFAHSRTVADLGGGAGCLIATILKKYPQIKGLLVERPSSLDAASARIKAEGLASRCDVQEADLLQVVPPGIDVYLLKHVLHGYEDERAVEILGNCRAVMGPDSRLLVIEFVIPPVIDHADPILERCLMSDLNMMAVTGGKERTEAEWRRIIEQAGLVLRRVIPVSGDPASMIEVSCRTKMN